MNEIERSDDEMDAVIESIKAQQQLNQVILNVAEKVKKNNAEIRRLRSDINAVNQNFEHASEYCALAPYASKNGICWTRAELSRHGMELTKRCRRKGIHVGSVPNEQYERVNTYPRMEMDAYFQEIFGRQ